MNDIHVVDVF